MTRFAHIKLFLPAAVGILAVALSGWLQQPAASFVESVTKREQLELRFIPNTVSSQYSGYSTTIAARGCLAGSANTCGSFSIAAAKVELGATYRCRVRLSPTRYPGQGSFQAECREPRLVEAAPQGLALMSGVKKAFLENLRGLDSDSSALVAGLAIGDDSALSKESLTNLRTVSLTHLTAVSGTNCAILVGLVFWLAGRLRFSRIAKFASAVVFLGAYLLLVGPQPSVIRAGVMALAVLLAKTVGRRVSPLRALSAAVILILVVTPAAVLDVGFQLSVAATLGLLILAPLVYQRLCDRLPKYLAAALAVAFAAQLFCLPILLSLQPDLPVYSIPANLLVEPVVPVVTVLGLLACISAPALAPLSQLLSFAASFATKWILLVASTFAGMPGASMGWPLGLAGVLAATATVGLVLLWFKDANKFGWVRFPLAALSLGLVIATSTSVVRAVAWLPAGWDVVSCDVGQGDSLVIHSQNRVALIDVGRYPRLIDRCLSRLGVSKIDLLVLTHFDQDHIGGLSGALKSRSVVTGLVGSAQDDRYAADQSKELLALATNNIIEAEEGLVGTLGGLTWRVLNPPRGGAGTEDFNDASVAILFSSATFDLLTLADLGERGQMRICEDYAVWSSSLHSQTPNGPRPLILKVAHHGSADFYPELYEDLESDVALISVGEANSYGHPTNRALHSLRRSQSAIFRTDLQGTIAIDAVDGTLRVSVSGSG